MEARTRQDETTVRRQMSRAAAAAAVWPLGRQWKAIRFATLIPHAGQYSSAIAGAGEMNELSQEETSKWSDQPKVDTTWTKVLSD